MKLYKIFCVFLLLLFSATSSAVLADVTSTASDCIGGFSCYEGFLNIGETQLLDEGRVKVGLEGVVDKSSFWSFLGERSLGYIAVKDLGKNDYQILSCKSGWLSGHVFSILKDNTDNCSMNFSGIESGTVALVTVKEIARNGATLRIDFYNGMLITSQPQNFDVVFQVNQTSQDQTIDSGKQTSFSVTASKGVSPFQFKLNYGDGTQEYLGSGKYLPNAENGTIALQSHTYSSKQNSYIAVASLTVTDLTGNSIVKQVNLTVEPSKATDGGTGGTGTPSTGNLAEAINQQVGYYYKCFTSGEDCEKAAVDEVRSYSSNYKQKCSTMIARAKGDSFESIVNENANSGIVTPDLARAIITVENSLWNINESTPPSYGLMQVGEPELKGTAYAFPFPQTDVFSNEQYKDPAKNVKRGTEVFNYYYQDSGSKARSILPRGCSTVAFENTGEAKDSLAVALTAAAYNIGPGFVILCDDFADDFKYAKNYASAVLAWHRIFVENFDKTPGTQGYCEPGSVSPPKEEPEEEPVDISTEQAADCSTIYECLALLDKIFRKQVFGK